MNDIAPGWYKDPAEPTTQRYWDGEGWIGEPLPADATPPSAPPDVAAPRAVTLPPGPAAGGPPAGATGGAPPAGAAWPGPGPGIGSLPPAPTTWPPAAPPAGAPPAGAHPGAAPPGAPPPGVLPPGAPPGALPPGALPPGGLPPGALPPGAVPGAWPPAGPPPNLPPGAPPGSIPWPAGVPLPPGYRLAYAPAQPRPHGLPVAPLGLRFLARLIDFGIMVGLTAVATGYLFYLFITDYAPVFSAISHQHYDNLPSVPGRDTGLAWAILVIAMAIWLAYEVPATAHSGQTFGKRVVGIKVMPLEGEEALGFRRALSRWVPLGMPMLLWTCGLGFILQLMDSISPAMGGPLRLAMHDRSVQTVVVQVGRRGHEITPVKVANKTGEQS